MTYENKQLHLILIGVSPEKWVNLDGIIACQLLTQAKKNLAKFIYLYWTEIAP